MMMPEDCERKFGHTFREWGNASRCIRCGMVSVLRPQTEEDRLRFANERGKEEERRHVVEWLRREAAVARKRAAQSGPGWLRASYESTAHHTARAADMIEAGEHRGGTPG